MTEKLFYKDVYQKEFQATVVSCEQGKDCYKIVLDKTAFFPEGGGQYGDLGWLNEIEVFDTHEKGDEVFHYTHTPMEPGTEVQGRLDWTKRFDRMQQHTGEHIISGLVHGRFGYNNVGFHLADEYCTMDFDGPITPEELAEIEVEANQVVFRNQPVYTLYPSGEELQTMEYRSKIEIEGQVRIIDIPGVDRCACCAPHLTATGQIGLIKLVRMDNYKGGERIYMLSGMRALKDYVMKDQNAKQISAALCVKEAEVAEGVEHLKEELSVLKNQMAALKQKQLGYLADSVSVEEEFVKVFDADLTGNEPRELMNILLEKGAKICGIFAGSDQSGYRYVIGSKSEDVRPISKKINAALSGRGGGKPVMVQGSLKGSREEILAVLAE